MMAEKINENLEEDNLFQVDTEFKEEFLGTLKKGTRKFYSYVLKRADLYEKQIGVSVFDFNMEERDDLLTVQFKNKSQWAFQTVRSPLKNYVDYCMFKNFTTRNENIFELILPSSYNKYVNPQAVENSYIPKPRVRELEELLINEQDKLFIELLSWGARGRTEKGNTLEELINLKVSDVDFERNTIKLSKNNITKKRVLYVDDFTTDLVKKTINKRFYVFNNGLKSKKNDEGIYEKTEKGFQINETDYVFRVPGKNKYGQIDHQLIANRIQRIQKWTNTPYLNISSLYFSSMIDEAKKRKAKKGELTRQDYVDINEAFSYGENGDIYLNKVKEMMSFYI